MGLTLVSGNSFERGIDSPLIAREKGNIGTLGGEQFDGFKANTVRAAVHDDFFTSKAQFHIVSPSLQ